MSVTSTPYPSFKTCSTLRRLNAENGVQRGLYSGKVDALDSFVKVGHDAHTIGVAKYLDDVRSVDVDHCCQCLNNANRQQVLFTN